MTSRPNNSRRGASKSKSTGKSAGVSLPNWAWLLAGLLIGVFAAFLAGLTPSAKDVRTVAEQVKASSGDDQKKDNQPVFDFYTLLPESEVTVSIVDPELRAEPRAEPTAVSTKAQKSKPGQKPATTAVTRPEKYLLQAGSFRSAKDAERLRAQLLLEGLAPRVERVNVGGGETWHRVQLGPFADRVSLQNAQKVLASQNIDSLLLQLK
ncbi:SPOR domain-containing protein [Endozoicomonas sp. SCSIO W0465]|uniref:SPOR domain-containing protein n=1 Tax=Endozoicomonas sp. SCSIO W0465 TaxID=2918516 RepID=UPI0020755CFB|nr:SPOR domain-containing protein [Endozoicomonas sp. SCSIO W0465]USE35349.1 SPOR domain-containing protein [Endozoicomonas sp. SCSIO W0465]